MNILFVGTFFDRNHSTITGQSVVSQLVIDYLESDNHVIKINIADSGKYQRGTLLFKCFRVYQFLCVYLKILWSLLSKRIDVVYYQPATSKFGITRDYISLKIFSIFKKNIVLHLLGYTAIDTIKSYGVNAWKRFCFNYYIASYIIVEGNKMKSEFVDFNSYENRVLTIANGYKNINIDNVKHKKYEKGNRFKLIYLSNMIFSKGYFDLVRALDILINKMSLDVECVFAGKFYQTLEAVDNDQYIGSQESFFSFIKEKRLEQRITFYTGLYGNEKYDAFTNANAFVLPTYYSGEGQPMAIIEAMSYGCVPIVTAHGHIPMMVNENNGCFVNAKDPMSIAEAVSFLMNNPIVYSDKSSKSIQDYKLYYNGETFGKSINDVLIQSIK